MLRLRHILIVGCASLGLPASADVLEWSDIEFIEGQYSRIYFDYTVEGATGTFYCVNDWIVNQDDGGVEGGLLADEYNRFDFGLAGSQYELRIYPDGGHDILKDGINDPSALTNFQSATSWSTSPNEPDTLHTIWELSFEVEGTTLTKFLAKDPPGGAVVVYSPPPMPSIVTTGPSAFGHYVDAEFRDVMTGSTLAPIPTRDYQAPVPDPWFDGYDFNVTFPLTDTGGVTVAIIPEPASLALLTLGGLAAVRRREGR